MQLGTSGMITAGLNLFDSSHVRTEEEPLNPESLDSPDVPVPLEPCPLEPAAKPYWLMRALYQTVVHPRGGYISTRLFVPREVWYIKGVKLKAVDDKISACDLLTAALMKLATVRQTDIRAVHDEMASLEGVLDRVQTTLTKKLGNEVGADGAASAFNIPNSSGEAPEGATGKMGGSSGGGRSYFSIRKLRTKTNHGLANHPTPSPSMDQAASLPMAVGDKCVHQTKRNLEGVTFGGPHAAYIAALAKLFDSAQILGMFYFTICG